MDPKFKKGFVHAGFNKVSGSNPINTLGDALAELSKCDGCGCNKTEGYWTSVDLSTNTLVLNFVWQGGVSSVPDTTANRALFRACCREREAGGAIPSCEALAGAGGVYTPTYTPTYTPI